MPPYTRPLLRAATWRRLPDCSRQRALLSNSSAAKAKLPGGTLGESNEQAVPLGPYYESILIKPTPVPEVKPELPPTSSPKNPRNTPKGSPPKKKDDTGTTSSATAPSSIASPSTTTPTAPQPSTEPASAQAKARIIFGSRLAGPIERAERLSSLRAQSTMIAGVLVPPRPEEPDNCCMSGCVNCVWDRYRDDVEEWVSASTKAEKALQAQRSQGPPHVLGSVSAVKGMAGLQGPGAVSMEDDGGGSEADWQADMKKADRPSIAKDLWDDDLYKNIPVGIREFMKQEKRLKEKHTRDGTFGA